MDPLTPPLEHCPECGGRVFATTGKGYQIPYAGVLVPLPDDVPIEVCERRDPRRRRDAPRAGARVGGARRGRDSPRGGLGSSRAPGAGDDGPRGTSPRPAPHALERSPGAVAGVARPAALPPPSACLGLGPGRPTQGGGRGAADRPDARAGLRDGPGIDHAKPTFRRCGDPGRSRARVGLVPRCGLRRGRHVASPGHVGRCPRRPGGPTPEGSDRTGRKRSLG